MPSVECLHLAPAALSTAVSRCTHQPTPPIRSVQSCTQHPLSKLSPASLCKALMVPALRQCPETVALLDDRPVVNISSFIESQGISLLHKCRGHCLWGDPQQISEPFACGDKHARHALGYSRAFPRTQGWIGSSHFACLVFCK